MNYSINDGVKCFSELKKSYLDNCKYGRRLSLETCKSYGFDLKIFTEFVETNLNKYSDEIRIEELNRELLRAFIFEQNSSFKVSTVKRRIACLRSFYNYLLDEGVVEYSPIERLHVQIKKEGRLPNCLELEEVKAILKAAYEFNGNPPLTMSEDVMQMVRLRDIAILEVLFATGMRVGELCSLSHSQLDFGTGLVRIIGKGNKERQLYIGSKDVITAVTNYLKQAEKVGYLNDRIFVDRWGEPISSQAIRAVVRKFSKLAGIKRKITPHVFRHTFATMLLEEGVDIRYIQEFLGHSSIATTQIYLHASEAKKKDILAKNHPRCHMSI